MERRFVTISGTSFPIECSLLPEHERTDTRIWNAWAFVAYDSNLNIYAADDVPRHIKTQETVIGESAATEEQARACVEAQLRSAIVNKSLEGTGFYSPPAGKIWPQEFPGRSPDEL